MSCSWASATSTVTPATYSEAYAQLNFFLGVTGWKYERSTALHQLVVLDLCGEVLEAGSHECVQLSSPLELLQLIVITH